MLKNSQGTNYPPQPDNPTDGERHFLAYYALSRQGRPEDFPYVKELMSPPADITEFARPGQFKGYKIGVIGGGLAGMAAAFELRKLGFDITIFDALSDRIGGRVYTYYFDEAKTIYGELGPMRTPVNHETTWHYINLLGLDTRTFIQVNENGYLFLRDARSRSNVKLVKKKIYPRYALADWEKGTPWPQLLKCGYDSHLFNTVPVERAEILQVKPRYNPAILTWDLMNNRQMLEAAGLSNDAISLLANLSPLAGNYLYNSYLDYIQEDYPPDLSYLYEIVGGFAKMPLAFFRSFGSSKFYNIAQSCLGLVKWQGSSWVTGIYKNAAAGKVLIAWRTEQADALLEEFDYVICAIPFSTLRDIEIKPLFSPLKMQAIKEVNYGNALKLLLLCKNRFWEEDGIIGGPSFTDLPITTLWYPTHYSLMNTPPDHPGALLIYNFNLDAVRLGNLPADMRFEKVKRDVEKVHGLRRGVLDDVAIGMKTVNWNSEEAFRGAFCYFTPEQKRLFSHAMALPEYDDRVFFAGEHVSAKHRWMQGALQSGMCAANALAAAGVRHQGA